MKTWAIAIGLAGLAVAHGEGQVARQENSSRAGLFTEAQAARARTDYAPAGQRDTQVPDPMFRAAPGRTRADRHPTRRRRSPSDGPLVGPHTIPRRRDDGREEYDSGPDGGPGMAKRETPPKARVSDEAVRAKTGKAWTEWFAVLDRAGAATLTHREIAAHL